VTIQMLQQFMPVCDSVELRKDPGFAPLSLVYLAGPISGQSYAGATNWRKDAAADLADVAVCLDPMRGKGYLRGERGIKDQYSEYTMSRAQGIVARDRWDVSRCDVVLMNLLGSTKVSNRHHDRGRLGGRLA